LRVKAETQIHLSAVGEGKNTHRAHVSSEGEGGKNGIQI
jgi:hypothetical protein